MHAGEKYFDDYQMGEIVPAASRTVTEADVVNFAGVSGDYHPLHVNDLFAQKSQFGRRIAHGMLTLTIMSGLMHSAGIAGYSVGASSSSRTAFLPRPPSKTSSPGCFGFLPLSDTPPHQY